MQDTILQFPSAQDLWRFKTRIEGHAVEINLANNTLLGRFSKEEIEIAFESSTRR